MGKMIKKYNEYLNDNFWKWFGDSKVIDDKGKPLIVYHGSYSNFDIFKPYRIRDGVYFTDTIKHSKDYGDTIYNVYLKIENPSILDAQHLYYDDYYDNMVREINWVRNNDEYDGVIIQNLKDPKDGKQFKNKKGEWVDYKSSTIYVVFNSEQIKSATNNNGNFDVNSKNINESHDKEI